MLWFFTPSLRAEIEREERQGKSDVVSILTQSDNNYSNCGHLAVATKFNSVRVWKDGGKNTRRVSLVSAVKRRVRL